ncbi:MAG TPA: zinc metalloprotease, partial [Chitinophaga sp.]|nr:zinc metalloprotease [Chitinophaga sp.]
MRNFTLFILALLYVLPTWAQRQCGTEVAMQELIASNPAFQKIRERKEAHLQEMTRIAKQNKALSKTTYSTVTIPVVVHIVLRNPAQVTDAQVMSQIAALNADYAAANSDLSSLPNAWKGVTGNPAIQFCLAQRTPDGNPTTGIDRVTTTRTSFSINSAASAVKHTTTGGIEAWDSENYLNIWVCTLADNYLGIATFPDTYSAAEQGVVVHYTAFGTSGTARSPYNRGRTTVHEIGHYFSLRHIWGDENNCAADDGIDDTPLQATATYDCPGFPLKDKCTVDSPGVMFNNYMDYTDDACMLLFTSDQADRMRASLNEDRASLLNSSGCIPLNLLNNDALIMEVLYPAGQICESSFSPSVVIKNQGLNTLTTAQINYQSDNGEIKTYSWTGSLTALKTDTVQLTSSSTTEGAHLLKVYTSLPNGVTDADATNDTAWAAFTYYADGSLPYEEGFEGNTFPPNGWEIK